MSEENEIKKEKLSDKIQEKLLESRTIFIFGEVDQELAKKVSAELLVLSALSDDPIKIFINSQGGHVESGDTIHDMIKLIKPDVYLIGTGWVASAGVTIYLAGDKDKRYALPNTRFMIHQPLGGSRGQATDIEIEAREIINIRARINKLISDATGQPIEKVKEDTDRNYWMGTQEAAEYGMVHKTISSIEDLKI